MSARTALRTATAAKHVMVDEAYGVFDLGDAASYRRFLTAHARALPPVERALGAVPTLPRFAPRADLLRQDLQALGLEMPDPLEFPEPTSDAAAFGALYVTEGSRLGGAMLARSVPADLPRAYLSAIHGAGAWRAFGAALDEAAQAAGPGWIDKAIECAEATFDLYARAAEQEAKA